MLLLIRFVKKHSQLLITQVNLSCYKLKIGKK